MYVAFCMGCLHWPNQADLLFVQSVILLCSCIDCLVYLIAHCKIWCTNICYELWWQCACELYFFSHLWADHRHKVQQAKTTGHTKTVSNLHICVAFTIETYETAAIQSQHVHYLFLCISHLGFKPRQRIIQLLFKQENLINIQFQECTAHGCMMKTRKPLALYYKKMAINMMNVMMSVGKCIQDRREVRQWW